MSSEETTDVLLAIGGVIIAIFLINSAKVVIAPVNQGQNVNVPSPESTVNPVVTSSGSTSGKFGNVAANPSGVVVTGSNPRNHVITKKVL